MPSVPIERQFQRFIRDPGAVINCLEDAILLLDKKTTVIFINKAAEEFLEKSQREIIGKKLGDLF